MLIAYHLTFFRGVFIWQFASGGEKCHLQSISLTTFSAQKCTQTLRIVAIWLYNWFDTRPLKSIIWVVFPPGFPPRWLQQLCWPEMPPKRDRTSWKLQKSSSWHVKRCVCPEQIIYGKGNKLEVTLLNIYTAYY